MCKDTEDKSDKDCTDKINQLEKKGKQIVYTESRYNSFDISSISINIKIIIYIYIYIYICIL